MPLPARPNQFLDTLEAEHRSWLASFEPQHLRNWEKLLKNEEENALSEAVVRRFLILKGLVVRPNEDLIGIDQRPDFRCESSNGHFYVEVTCITIDTATAITGLSKESNNAMRPSPLTKKIQAICKKKAVQCDNHDAPVLVAICTFHSVACMFSFSTPYLDMLLTGTSSMSVRINRVTLESIPGVEIDSDPSTSAFLRYDNQSGLNYARSSISGLLMCGVSIEPTWVIGILHPNPARPFDTQLLSDISFGEVEIDQESGQLRTSWPRVSSI